MRVGTSECGTEPSVSIQCRNILDKLKNSRVQEGLFCMELDILLFVTSVGRLACRVVGWLVGWLVCRLVGWLVRWLVGWLVCWLVGYLFVRFVFLLVGWMVCRLMGWLGGYLVSF